MLVIALFLGTVASSKFEVYCFIYFIIIVYLESWNKRTNFPAKGLQAFLNFENAIKYCLKATVPEGQIAHFLTHLSVKKTPEFQKFEVAKLLVSGNLMKFSNEKYKRAVELLYRVIQLRKMYNMIHMDLDIVLLRLNHEDE